MLESDLYPPIRDYLETHGYQVQAEVKNCDIIATKDDELIVVELKTSVNMTLLVQATQRQTIADSVYVAVPSPKRQNRHWRGIKRVIKRLELGLLEVSCGPMGTKVLKQFDPLPAQRRKVTRTRKAIIQEVAGRSGSYNTGGVNKQKLMTAYKENAILIACFLNHIGPSSSKTLKLLGTGEKTYSILVNNHYGWFQRIERGVFQITDQGAVEASSFTEIYKRAETLLKSAQTS